MRCFSSCFCVGGILLQLLLGQCMDRIIGMFGCILHSGGRLWCISLPFLVLYSLWHVANWYCFPGAGVLFEFAGGILSMIPDAVSFSVVLSFVGSISGTLFVLICTMRFVALRLCSCPCRYSCRCFLMMDWSLFAW